MTKRWWTTFGIGCVFCAVAGGLNAAHGQSLAKPLLLPAEPLDYVDYAVNNLPAHFADEVSRDSTPPDNPITDAGATLGRVLFYDRRLSHNNSMSCASCHSQETGFSQETATSLRADGAQTDRHSMALANGRFFGDGVVSGRNLSDLSAATLDEQSLRPVITGELGIAELGRENIGVVINKLEDTDYYEDLFQYAFGEPDDPNGSAITEDRLAQALSQFVRSMVSYNAKFDSIFDANGNEDPALLAANFTEQERLGKELFHGRGRCADCHQGNSQTTLTVHNNGLDAETTDPGAGDGMFKSASLRNVEVRGSFVHDGRFSSLEEVVDFYSNGIQDHPNLDFRLTDSTGPVDIAFTDDEAAAVVAFLTTLTDQSFLTDERFSDPFVLTCDFDANDICNTDDLDSLLALGPLANASEVDPADAQYDLNGDGVLDQADAATWRADAAEANGFAFPYQPGDANLDGVVDVHDFDAWNANRFADTTAWSQGDFNGDGIVDASDFGLWNTNRGHGPPQQVPEPTTAVWLPLWLLLFSMLYRSFRYSR